MWTQWMMNWYEDLIGFESRLRSSMTRLVHLKQKLYIWNRIESSTKEKKNLKHKVYNSPEENQWEASNLKIAQANLQISNNKSKKWPTPVLYKTPDNLLQMSTTKLTLTKWSRMKCENKMINLKDLSELLRSRTKVSSFNHWNRRG